MFLEILSIHTPIVPASFVPSMPSWVVTNLSVPVKIRKKNNLIDCLPGAKMFAHLHHGDFGERIRLLEQKALAARFNANSQRKLQQFKADFPAKDMSVEQSIHLVFRMSPIWCSWMDSWGGGFGGL